MPPITSQAMPLQTGDPQQEIRFMQVVENNGDLFHKAPENSIMVHACNCRGIWGAGIARKMRDRYPEVYKAHQAYVRRRPTTELLGNQLLGTATVDAIQWEKRFVGCLFASRDYGTRVDAPSDVLDATELAMVDLLEKIRIYNFDASPNNKITSIYMPRICTGLFGLDWQVVKARLEGLAVVEGFEFIHIVDFHVRASH